MRTKTFDSLRHLFVHKTTSIILRVVISLGLLIGLYVAFAKSANGMISGLYLSNRSFISVLAVLGLLICSTLVNWGLESLKWQKSASQIRSLSFSEAFKQVLKGIAFTMITPNRIGEFYGRVEGWSRKDAIKGAIINSYNGFFQSTVTIIAGVVAMILAPASWKLGVEEYISLCLQFIQSNTYIVIPAILLFIGIITIYWNTIIRLFNRIKSSLPEDLTLSIKVIILLLSAGRYLVFSSQFVLLLWFVGVDMPITHLFAGVAMGYFILFTLPSVALAELGIRELSFALVFGAMGADISLIFLASLVLWLVNLFLPALCGIGLYLNGYRTTSSTKLELLADRADSKH